MNVINGRFIIFTKIKQTLVKVISIIIQKLYKIK
jgi:hypothetical protein